MADCRDLGTCTDLKVIEGKYNFEEKVYDLSEAAILLRDTFAQTQILQHIRLDGETSTGGDRQITPFVTFHEDVRPGFRKRIYRDLVVSSGWRSAANGYCDKECGFFGGTTQREVQIDTFLCTHRMRQHEEICMSEFLATWKQDMLSRGMLNLSDDVFISAEIYYAMEKANYIAIDTHFWHGDFGSQDKNVMHTDGIIKQAVYALTNNEQADIVEFTFAGLDSTNCIEGVVGGEGGQFNIPFNTDIATTLADFRAELISTDAVTGLPKYRKVLTNEAYFPNVTVVGLDTIRIESIVGEEICLDFLITNCDGFERCNDGSISHVTEITNGATVTSTFVQQYRSGNAPIGITKEPIHAGNAIQKIRELSEAIQAKRPEIINDPEFNLFVAPNVYIALQFALKDLTAGYTNVTGPMTELDAGLYGFGGGKIIKANYLARDEMYYFRRQDVHVATDLFSDVSEILMVYDAICDLVKFKNEFALGFLISDFNKFAGTLCNRSGEFQPLQGCDIC